MAVSRVLLRGFPHKGGAAPRLLLQDRVAVQIGLTLAVLIVLLVMTHVVARHLTIASDFQNEIAKKIYFLVDLEGDGSVSEMFNHGMLFAASLIFLGLFFETRARLPLVISMLMAFAWLDDALQYHEKMGALLADGLQLPSVFGLRPKDLGEIGAWGMAGLVFLPLLAWAFVGRRAGDELLLRMIAIPAAALVVCAILIDLLHILAVDPAARLFFAVLEDGGEMLAVAAVATVAIAALRNARSLYGAA